MPDIKQISAVKTDNSYKVFGLGADMQVYEWEPANGGNWKSYSYKPRTPEEEAAITQQFKSPPRINPGM